ncbi:scavenger mRNA decapping enzyme [Choiromyces venosus 120613-1]|uniref:Scavenger mRNA decapping enzyme n=1 Tax=Choiromyces venosus 120613-1 TaxID=1336337 RepID=A0A3N4K165_9PEZI|nr:scavenger mRNA decapping enzyme [Choiromyces venosus 120613-1]
MSTSNAAEQEAKLRKFTFTRILNQDTKTKTVNLLGEIESTPAILIAEKTAFNVTDSHLTKFSHHLHLPKVSLIERNDIYHWFLASQNSEYGEVKLTLIFPVTETHIRKYTHQQLRMVVETPEIYRDLVKPYVEEKRGNGRLNWAYNILEHKAEKESVILEDPDDLEGFMLLPDLKWDRKTMASMYITAILRRRDITSMRDLKKKHVPWLKNIRRRIPEAICQKYDDIEEDQIKLYVHYQPSYYHFHLHAVSITHDGGLGQASGKAFLLGNLISWLESLGGDEEAGLDGVELTYLLGEESELWQSIFKGVNGKKGKVEE